MPLKNIIKSCLHLAGYEINKISKSITAGNDIGSDKRPVGDMRCLLEDLKHRGLKCRTFLDVGANDAMYSRMVKGIFPNASFCLIEPLIEMKEYIELFCRDFSNTTYIRAGAASKSGKLTMTVWDGFAGSSFVPSTDQTLLNNGKQRDVEVITIDDLIDSKKLKLPELIKLDIQGFEVEALKGAIKTFGFTEVYIIEVSLFPYNESPQLPVFSDVVSFMLDRDYVVYDFPGFLRRPLDGALGQCDVCFVKKHGFLKTKNGWDS